MYRLSILASAADAETIAGELFELGAGGCEEHTAGEKALLVAYASDREDAERFATEIARYLDASGLPVAEFSIEPFTDERWKTAWTEGLAPIWVTGAHLVVSTDWTGPVPNAEHVIRLEPSASFGGGDHATTRLAARSVERASRETPGARVLDVGSGTGILGFVALSSGAAELVGVDHDEVAVKAARRNAELNAFGSRSRFEVGLDRAGTAHDLVVANIDAPTLVALAARIARAAERTKLLTLTGFLAEVAETIVVAYSKYGFRVARRETNDDWALVDLSRD